MYAVALASGNVIALEVADSEKFLVEHRLHLRASLPAAEAADHQLSAQSVDRDGRAGVLRRRREAGPEVRLHGHQRLRLRRRRLRRLPAAQFSGRAGGEGRRRRVHDDEQGLQHGRLARAASAAATPRWCGPSARSRATTITACSRRFRSPRSSPCGTPTPRSKRSRESTKRAATCWSMASAGMAGKSRRRGPACSSGAEFPSPGSAA